MGFHDFRNTRSANLRAIPPDPLDNSHSQLHTEMNRFKNSKSDPSVLIEKLRKVAGNSKLRFPPPEVLPCANVEATKYRACPNPGNKACSSCRLVSYCSKECQSAHWHDHKSDCRNYLKYEGWKPAWIAESRSPTFISNLTLKEEVEKDMKEKLSMGLALWGNTPAMDLVNLSENEKDAKADLSLASIASGDLRHVVYTINRLPADYTGKLCIMLNDQTPHVVVRNVVLLLLLGNISDETTAVNSALHFWYSAFMPSEYNLLITSEIASFIKTGANGIAGSELGTTSKLSCSLTPELMEIFSQLLLSDLSIEDAQVGYDAVREAPSRRDFRDRMYARLKPSHRVSFHTYRRFGIVLPFGACNIHFNFPNRSLFTTTGRWLQTDYADPLGGWHIDEIFEAGKLHGAQSEDIYGCLYFFLSDQLREFTKRIRRLNISFHCLDYDARILAQGIKEDIFSDHGVPASVRFDRIEVSNILDVNYVGIEGVLDGWACLLKTSKTAAIVGYFMNWVVMQPDGRAQSAGPKEMEQLMDRLKKEGKSPLRSMPSMSKKIAMRPADLLTMVTIAASSMDAMFDNSKPFDTFLRKQGIDRILKKTNLTLRKRHTIVPHRIKVPLDSPPDALPEFVDDESWYRHVNLLNTTFSERYIELVNR